MQGRQERSQGEEFLHPGELTYFKEFITSLVVPEVSTTLREAFEGNERARAERRISALLIDKKHGAALELTTSADLGIDELIRTRLSQQFPHIRYLSEDILQKGEKVTAEDLRKLSLLWIVDAIDGTGRFASHSPRFSTSIALVSFGKPILAVVHDAMNDVTYSAQADTPGAFTHFKPIEVSDIQTLDKATLSTAYAWDPVKRVQDIRILERLRTRVSQPGVNTASSVLDLVDVATGETAGHYSIGLKPWDVAAAAFLVEKAGGRVTRLNGQDWDVFCDDILATNGLIHDDLVDLINGGEVKFSLGRMKRAGLVFSGPLHVLRTAREKMGATHRRVS